jgi:hypothetical protein
MLRWLRWLQTNQERFRRHAQALWLLYTLPILVPAYLHFPHAAPLLTATYLAPLVFANMPTRHLKTALALYALLWCSSFGIALGPVSA